MAVLLLVGVLLIGFPDGAEIVNLGAALILAAGLVPFGLAMVLDQVDDSSGGSGEC